MVAIKKDKKKLQFHIRLKSQKKQKQNRLILTSVV